MNLERINARAIATTCSPVHIENVIIDLAHALKEAEHLAHEVMSLNAMSGTLGQGKCLNMQAVASRILNKIGETK